MPNEAETTNRTRDHLANERTFLAWVRTSLGLMGLGFVMARMGLFLRQLAAEFPEGSTRHGRHEVGHEYMVVGVVLLLLGAALVAASAWQHDRNRRAIDADHYAPSRLAIFGLATVVVAGGLVLVALVIWRTSSPAG